MIVLTPERLIVVSTGGGDVLLVVGAGYPAVAGIERLDRRQVQQRAGAGGREQVKIDRAGKRPRTKARRGIAGRGKAVDVDLSRRRKR